MVRNQKTYSWLEITTQVGCKNQCVYCPQDKFMKAYSERSNITKMCFDTFKKCIDKVPKSVDIMFAGFSEPWLNPECTKMMMYAYKKGFTIQVYTTTVGMKLSDINLIKKIPFQTFFVHLPRSKTVSKLKINKNYFKIINKLIKSYISNIRISKPHEMTSRAGNVKGEIICSPKENKSILSRCERLYKNILLPNGDVALCCMDWSLKHILGNLIKSDYESLFKGKEFLKIIKGLKDKSSDILCRKCEYSKFIIDSY